MRLYIAPNRAFSAPIRWVFELLAHYQQVRLSFVDQPDHADCRVTEDATTDFPLALDFYEALQRQEKPHSWQTPSGQTDVLAHLFYLINDLETHWPSPDSCDAWGRFRWAAHSRAKQTEQRTAEYIIEELQQKHPIWSVLPAQKRRSALFLSHDIDSLYGSFWHDGLWALKRGRLQDVLKLIVNVVKNRPAWFNLADIQRIHTQRGLKSTFFWLALQGRGAHNIKNADYDVRSPAIQAFWAQATAAGFDMGLHKTTHSTSFEVEMSRLPPPSVAANRYHFLKYELPAAWQSMSDAGVRLDASLGFAEQAGFRNGYALPFHPYDTRTQSKMPLLVAPLHLMDGTLWHYMRLPKTQIAAYMIEFLEKNRENAVLSLLWHNTEFAEFQHQGFRQIYETVLDYAVDQEWPALTARDLLRDYTY